MPETNRNGEPLEFCEECGSPLVGTSCLACGTNYRDGREPCGRGSAGQEGALPRARQGRRSKSARFLRPLAAAGGTHGPSQEANRIVG